MTAFEDTSGRGKAGGESGPGGPSGLKPATELRTSLSRHYGDEGAGPRESIASKGGKPKPDEDLALKPRNALELQDELALAARQKSGTLTAEQQRSAEGIAKVKAKGRTYHYAWRGGPRLRGEPGSPEFMASYNEAVEQRRAPDKSRFRFVVTDYKASSEYKKLAESTRKQWGNWLDRIGDYFGDLRIAQFDRPEKPTKKMIQSKTSNNLVRQRELLMPCVI